MCARQAGAAAHHGSEQGAKAAVVVGQLPAGALQPGWRSCVASWAARERDVGGCKTPQSRRVGVKEVERALLRGHEHAGPPGAEAVVDAVGRVDIVGERVRDPHCQEERRERRQLRRSKQDGGARALALRPVARPALQSLTRLSRGSAVLLPD